MDTSYTASPRTVATESERSPRLEPQPSNLGLNGGGLKSVGGMSSLKDNVLNETSPPMEHPKIEQRPVKLGLRARLKVAQESLTTVLEELASLKVQNSRLGRDSLKASEHATQMHSEATLSICLTLSRIPKVTVTIHLTLRLA